MAMEKYMTCAGCNEVIERKAVNQMRCYKCSARRDKYLLVEKRKKEKETKGK